MMKRWGLLILLLLLGCAGAERPSTPTATAIPPTSQPTAIPTETATAVPTATSTLTATPTELPTETPEPTLPPPPTLTPTPTNTSVPETAVPAVTRHSTVERWQGVAEYSFFSQSRQQEIFFTIFTPPGYEQSEDRYPVLYFLHGSQGSHILFWNAVSREVPAANGEAGAWLSQLMEAGELPPFILVAPNDTDGGWGDENEVMVTQELIWAIDGNWRTIANRNGRSLMGFSLGAAGAMRYPARHSDLYCNTMVLAESAVDEAATLWAVNQEAVLANGLEVRLAVGQLDERAVNVSTAVSQILEELSIPHELLIIPDVPHDFGKLFNQIHDWAFDFYTSCWAQE